MADKVVNKNLGRYVIICSSVFLSTVTLFCSIALCRNRRGILKEIKKVSQFLCCFPISFFKKNQKIVLPNIDKNISVNLSDDKLEEKFMKACNTVRTYRSKMKLEQWLLLYGLYKQSNEGNADKKLETTTVSFINEHNSSNNHAERTETNFFEKEKMKAWKQCHGLDSKKCKFLYITYFYQWFPDAVDNVNTNMTMDTSKSVSKIKDVEEDDMEKSLCDQFCYDVVTNKIDNVRESLKKHPDLVNQKNSDGLTALHFACDRGYLNIAKLLIDNGADVDMADSCGDTSLHMAAYSEQTEIIDLLIASGADKKKKNSEGFTMQDILNEK